MRTDGMTEVLPLDKKQKVACNIAMGVILVIAGVIIILAAVGVLPVSARVITAPTVLFGVGAALLATALISKNSVSMWISGVVLACGMTSLLAVTTPAGYSELYPIYIAAPGIGCVCAMLFAEAKTPLVKAALFFGGLSGVFALKSSGLCGWGITGGVLAAYVGVCVLVFAISKYLCKDEYDA